MRVLTGIEGKYEPERFERKKTSDPAGHHRGLHLDGRTRRVPLSFQEPRHGHQPGDHTQRDVRPGRDGVSDAPAYLCRQSSFGQGAMTIISGYCSLM